MEKESRELLNFYKMLSELEEAFDYKLTDAKLALYYKHLNNLPDEYLKRGVAETIKSETSFPTIAAIRKASGIEHYNCLGPDMAAANRQCHIIGIEPSLDDDANIKACIAEMKAIVKRQGDKKCPFFQP